MSMHEQTDRQTDKQTHAHKRVPVHMEHAVPRLSNRIFLQECVPDMRQHTEVNGEHVTVASDL